MKKIILLILLINPFISFAVEGTYSCEEKSSASIDFNKDGNKWITKPEASTPKNPSSFQIGFYPTEAVLLGNLGGEKLKKLSQNSFIEVTGSGNINLWTVFPAEKDRPLFVIVQKSYVLVTPYSLSIAYECKKSK